MSELLPQSINECAIVKTVRSVCMHYIGLLSDLLCKIDTRYIKYYSVELAKG